MKSPFASWLLVFLLIFSNIGTAFSTEFSEGYSDDYNQLSAEDQKNYHEIFRLVHEYSGLGDAPDRAGKMINALIKKYPKNFYPWVAYADYIVVIERDNHRAYELVDKMYSYGSNIVDLKIIYSQLQREVDQNCKSALEIAESAHKLSLTDPSAMAELAEAEHCLGNYSQSEVWGLKSIENQPNPIRRANLYSGLGNRYATQKNPDIKKAAAAWNSAAKLAYDKSPWLLNNMAMNLYRSTEEYDNAIDYLEQALLLMKFNMANINLGYAEYYKLGDSLAHPKKYLKAARKPLSPEKIFNKTKMIPEHAFVHFSTQKVPVLSKYLLENGYVKDVDYYDDSDLSVQSGEDGTALMLAITSRNLDYIKYLVEKGANINMADHTNKTPIFYAVLESEEAATKDTFEVVKYLIYKGANVKVMDKEGRGVPYYALGGSKDVMKLLFQSGANPKQVDSQGISLLGYAVKFGDFDTVKLLIEQHKCDPDAQVIPQVKTSAVAFSATREGKWKEILKYLLSRGANPWVKLEGRDVLDTLGDPVNKDIPGNAEVIMLITEARKYYSRPKDFYTY
jgi:tetratricopeptide (TPR) repeat protein